MGLTSFLVLPVIATLFLTPQEYKRYTPVAERSEVLVRGVSDETAEDWIAFLLKSGVCFELKDSGKEIRVRTGAERLLEAACAVASLETEAERSIQERRLERWILTSCPTVSRAEVCLVPPGDGERQAAVFVVARGFDGNRTGELLEKIREMLGEEAVHRTVILGADPPAKKRGANDSKRVSVALN